MALGTQKTQTAKVAVRARDVPGVVRRGCCAKAGSGARLGRTCAPSSTPCGGLSTAGHQGASGETRSALSWGRLLGAVATGVQQGPVPSTQNRPETETSLPTAEGHVADSCAGPAGSGSGDSGGGRSESMATRQEKRGDRRHFTHLNFRKRVPHPARRFTDAPPGEGRGSPRRDAGSLGRQSQTPSGGPSSQCLPPNHSGDRLHGDFC